MGLEMVEIMMEIEDTFGITIPDNQYLDLQTVGHLHAFVLAKVLDRSHCIIEEKMPGHFSDSREVTVFRNLRENLSSISHVDEQKIRSSTRLDSLFPRKTRLKDWKRLQEESNYKIPSLYYSGWWSLYYLILLFIISGIGIYIASHIDDIQLSTNLATISIFSPFIIIYLSCSYGFFLQMRLYFFRKKPEYNTRFGKEFPDGMQTVRELVASVMKYDGQYFEKTQAGLLSNNIYNHLLSIIARVGCIDRSKIKPDSDLSEIF